MTLSNNTVVVPETVVCSPPTISLLAIIIIFLFLIVSHVQIWGLKRERAKLMTEVAELTLTVEDFRVNTRVISI
jgi:hypothetical protein